MKKLILHDAAEGLLEVCIIYSTEALTLSLIWAFPGAEYLYYMGQINASLCELPPWAGKFPASGTLKNTTASALFYLGRKVWNKFISPLPSPLPLHQLSSRNKTSSATLSCTCIVKLCSAVTALPVSWALPDKKDHNPSNWKQQLLLHQRAQQKPHLISAVKMRKTLLIDSVFPHP